MATVARLKEAAGRIVKVSVRLLTHPGGSASTDGGLEEEEVKENAVSASVPEIKFTAILATVAVRIRAIVSGFTLPEAR